MKILIRTDASLQIGTGHVMRCLTLADALTEKGVEVRFICRNHIGNLIEYIQSKGYFVYQLDIPKKTGYDEAIEFSQDSQLSHANWLGCTQEEDASTCESILKKIHPDWLVVDHYAIDRTWHNELKGLYTKLMVIDDLADRYHQCDLLLDQTYGRQQHEYKDLVPANCQLLLGSQFALLRPEFQQWREYSLSRREQPKLRKLLITMGGVDQDNVTSQVLATLKSCELPKELEITVIMGKTAPHLNDVKTLAESMPCKTQVKVSVNNMAEIMANSDLAIGAAGATTWERCCLGLPSILVVLADNQKDIANLISNAEAAIKFALDEIGLLCDTIVKAENDLDKISKKSASISDGRGVSRVIEAML